jgi:hypothetical protein
MDHASTFGIPSPDLAAIFNEAIDDLHDQRVSSLPQSTFDPLQLQGKVFLTSYFVYT